MSDDTIRLERGSLLGLLDEAVVLARRVFGRVYLATAIPPAVALGAIGVYQVRNMQSFSAQAPDMGRFFTGFGLVFFLYLLYAAATGLADAAMVAGVSRELDGQEVRAGALWRWVFQGRVLVTLTGMGLMIGVGFLLCGLPGIYLTIVYALVVPILAAEDVSGYAALSRSRALVLHSNEKRVFAPGLGWVILVFLTAMVLTYGVSMAIQFPLTILSEVLMMRNILGEAARQAEVARNPFAAFPAWFFAVQAVVTLLSGLAKQLVALYSAAAFTLLFRRLRGRKEGTDLVAALDALGAPE